MPTRTDATRNAATQGDHTHAPVGVDTDSDLMAVLAMVSLLKFSLSLCMQEIKANLFSI